MSFIKKKVNLDEAPLTASYVASDAVGSFTRSNTLGRPTSAGSFTRPGSSSRPGSSTRRIGEGGSINSDTYIDSNITSVREEPYYGSSSRKSGKGDIYTLETDANYSSARRGNGDIKRKKKYEDDEEEESPDDIEKREEPTTIAEEWPSVLADGWRAYILRTLHDMFLTSWLNLLLFCIPFSIIAKLAAWPDAVIFIFSLLSLCPLAERIAFVTDEMAKYTNDTLGGLMSASMGNVTELIVSLVALAKGGSLLIVVQLSLLGSVISNLLLVLGMSFLVGGIKNTIQRFSKPATAANTGLLLVSVISILLPSLLIATSTTHPSDAESQFDPNISFSSEDLLLSRFASLIMLIVYGLLIFYQLKTHRSLFEAQEDEEEDEEPPVLGLWGSIFWAGVITVFISFLSEFIVDSIEGAAGEIGIPVMFISAILLPLVGNAAEHVSALIFAWRNKMDISLGIAIGSATQISLFVLPFSVVIGWMASQPLTLNFGVFHIAVMFMTILIVSIMVQSGQSDYLKGAMLVSAYIFIAGAYWVIQTPFIMAEKND